MNVHSPYMLAALGCAVALLAACSGSSKTEEIPDDPASTESGSVKAPPTSSKTTVTPPAKGDDGTNQPGTDDTSNPPAKSSGPAEPTPPDNPGTNGVNRVSVNEHCCYGDQYFRCPDAVACFGGFDVDACLQACSGPADPCFSKCFDKEASAPAPKGCQAMTAPKGIDCANGNFDL